MIQCMLKFKYQCPQHVLVTAPFTMPTNYIDYSFRRISIILCRNNAVIDIQVGMCDTSKTKACPVIVYFIAIGNKIDYRINRIETLEWGRQPLGDILMRECRDAAPSDGAFVSLRIMGKRRKRIYQNWCRLVSFALSLRFYWRQPGVDLRNSRMLY